MRPLLACITTLYVTDERRLARQLAALRTYGDVSVFWVVSGTLAETHEAAVRDVLDAMHPDVVIASPRNVGKATSVNRAMQVLPPSVQHILVVDADIQFPRGMDSLVRHLAGVFRTHASEIAAVAPEQTADRRHGPRRSETFCACHPSLRLALNPVDLAGGCVVISRAAWTGVGPFPVGEAYSSEDVRWFSRARIRGWATLLDMEVSVEHPRGDDSAEKRKIRLLTTPE